MLKLGVLLPTVSRHHPELYRRLAEDRRVSLDVVLCSRHGLDGRELVEEFSLRDDGRPVRPDATTGYEVFVLRDYLPSSALMGIRHFNPGFVVWLAKAKPDAVLAVGWNHLTFALCVVACRGVGIPVLVSGDATIWTEGQRSYWFRVAKKATLGRLLKLANACLFRSALNRQLFEYYGVPEERLFRFPLSVDWNTLRQTYLRLADKRPSLRKRLGVPGIKDLLVLFVGRLSEEKRVIDLVLSWSRIEARVNGRCIIIGDGDRRELLEKLAYDQGCEKLEFSGFVDYHQLPEYYTAADVLVLPSASETHGDVVKEAYCFDTCAVVSDRVGASYDLVDDQINGRTFSCGDREQLASILVHLAEMPPSKRAQMGARGAAAVGKDWNHSSAIEGLIEASRHVMSASR